ncbi:real-time [Bombus vancouverensis nearcticus]|uniref:Protein real-time isoform X2 n=2 Tax=Pyrobombus TaxID=144703 RepID=A0A6P8N9E7_9HYME|nr:protein real-time isoform X2 [Bombus impatiens]XP_033198813.1 protein real-time isoform X2 [Bombus vancouverensis nearcticus]XP_033317663.1 protein real-time isoform X2 [Bombus bifarius]
MVQQYQSPVRVYKHPFPLVMMAYERRFPTCPKIPVFVGCEIVSDEESKNGSIRITERRCKLNVEAPYILKKIIGVDFVYFIQRNVLNRRNSVLEIEAYNESFSSRVSVIEKCRYFVHPENPEWTCFEQTASLDIKNFFGFENSMEKLAMKQYAQNIAKGKEIIEYFINQLKEEGIVYVPPWEDPNDISEKNEGDIAKSQESLVPEETYSCADNKLQNREMQLSSDYIERYLGKLDMMQESKLIQLRQSIKELRGSSIPGDATLLRFLRATEFSVEKAKEMLTQTLHWRKKHQIDKLLEEYDIPQVVKDYFPGGWHHFDKDGQPLYILRMGQMDVKGLLKSIGEDDLLLLVLHICEEGLVLMEEATAVSGHPVSQWCLLIDLEGLNMRHLWRPGIKALLRIIEIVEINYPETMGRVLIMRAPRCFPILWTLISTFINENTRKKFIFYCGTNYQEQGPGSLSDYIDPEFIPDFLGGSSEAYITEGGIVPKHLYKMELEPTSSQEEHNLYHCISLSRGQIHRVIIRSNDPGAVLTWDFDVMRHNIIFTVLYQAYNDDKDLSLESVTAEDAELLEMKEIKGHFIKVEPSIVCHDGESIQGSHIMQNAGVYILQWHNQDDPGEFLPSISGHKAQLMYFYETLSSVHYRGSMMSLQSAISTKSEATSFLSR